MDILPDDHAPGNPATLIRIPIVLPDGARVHVGAGVLTDPTLSPADQLRHGVESAALVQQLFSRRLHVWRRGRRPLQAFPEWRRFMREVETRLAGGARQDALADEYLMGTHHNPSTRQRVLRRWLQRWRALPPADREEMSP